MFQISAQAKHPHFYKCRNINSSIEKYMTFINLNTFRFQTNTHLGLENTGQI